MVPCRIKVGNLFPRACKEEKLQVWGYRISISNTCSMHFDVFPAFAALFLQADNIISMDSPTQLSFTNWDIGIIRITPSNGN